MQRSAALWADLRRAELLPENAPTPENDQVDPPSSGRSRAATTAMSPDLSIARDYGLDDLRPMLAGITATVLVRAADSDAGDGVHARRRAPRPGW
jgi:hypothetical protein